MDNNWLKHVLKELWKVNSYNALFGMKHLSGFQFCPPRMHTLMFCITCCSSFLWAIPLPQVLYLLIDGALNVYRAQPPSLATWLRRSDIVTNDTILKYQSLMQTFPCLQRTLIYWFKRQRVEVSHGQETIACQFINDNGRSGGTRLATLVWVNLRFLSNP